MIIKEMSVGDRLVLAGNLLGSIAVTLVSIGGILRSKELPDQPLFSKPNEGFSSREKEDNQILNEDSDLFHHEQSSSRTNHF